MIFTHKHRLLPALAGMTAVALTATALAGPPHRHQPAQHRLAIKQEPSPESHPLSMHFRGAVANAPDLTLTDVTVERIRLRGQQFAARLRVTVINVGTADWKSDLHQQAVMAHVGDEPFLVGTKLKSLRAGASRTFTVTLPLLWGAGHGDAPPLKIALEMDDDIHRDGNPANDDADASDNHITLEGSTVNAMVGP
ncbi:MAG: hypothetical protein HKO57_13390 [Akkermansiaceae bacterium]|nr:hypothetical protein [Akkermansiaceae bacterium]